MTAEALANQLPVVRVEQPLAVTPESFVSHRGLGRPYPHLIGRNTPDLVNDAVVESSAAAKEQYQNDNAPEHAEGRHQPLSAPHPDSLAAGHRVYGFSIDGLLGRDISRHEASHHHDAGYGQHVSKTDGRVIEHFAVACHADDFGHQLHQLNAQEHADIAEQEADDNRLRQHQHDNLVCLRTHSAPDAYLLRPLPDGNVHDIRHADNARDECGQANYKDKDRDGQQNVADKHGQLVSTEYSDSMFIGRSEALTSGQMGDDMVIELRVQLSSGQKVRPHAQTAQLTIRAPYSLNGAQRSHNGSCGVRLQHGLIDSDYLEIDSV